MLVESFIAWAKSVESTLNEYEGILGEVPLPAMRAGCGALSIPRPGDAPPTVARRATVGAIANSLFRAVGNEVRSPADAIPLWEKLLGGFQGEDPRSVAIRATLARELDELRQMV